MIPPEPLTLRLEGEDRRLGLKIEGSTDVLSLGLGLTDVSIQSFRSGLARVLGTLFSNDEPGFLLTASPETCFTDTAGTTLAEPGDPVALWLDQSGNDNHATQPTTANRPILGRKPVGGRRNLLERTEEWDDSIWVYTRSELTSGQEEAPDGSMTAALITSIDVTGLQRVENDASVDIAEGETWTFSIFAKAGSRDFLLFEFSSDAFGTTSVDRRVLFDLKNVEVSDQRENINSASIEDVGNGWRKLSASITAISSINNETRVFRFIPSDESIVFGSGSVGGSGFVWRPQLEVASEATPYQRVGSRFDVTEAGVPDRHYLFFGGASDPRWMQTPVITPNTDKVQVFAGIRPFDMSSSGFADNRYVVATGVGDNDFFLAAPRSSDDEIGFRLAGDTGLVLPRGFTFPAMNSYVVNGFGDISADVGFLRVNGTLEDTRTASLGGGDISDNPVFIGSRDGTQQYFNGEISALTTRFGPNLTNNQIELVERFTASKVAEETIT